MSKHVRKVLGLLQHRKQIQQIPPPHQQPTSRTPEEWSTYWKAQGQPWRTEPEIDKKRQEYLAKRRLITPNIEQGIYPFKGEKLSRADVEWLLSTHETGGIRGPVDWSDERQREREGLDVRGADLCKVDLRNLPLARLCGGLNREEWSGATKEQRKMAIVLMNEADLSGFDLSELEAPAHEAYRRKAHLQGPPVKWTLLQGADLREARLEKADLSGAQLKKADLFEAELEGANLSGAQLEKANLGRTQLQGANLFEAELQGADLRRAKLQGANLEDVMLGDKNGIGPRFADIQWSNTNLAVVDWSQVEKLGDEHLAYQWKSVEDYRVAVRANRQLAVVLRDQGLNEEADHFAYRAQLLQRVIFRQQWQFGSYLFSGFLDLLAGYGYRPLRSVFWYLFIIGPPYMIH